MTKKEKRYVDLYAQIKVRELSDCYSRPSCAKQRAETLIRAEMLENGGHGYKVLTFNAQMFTCAYQLGNSLVVHTPSQKMQIAL